MSTNVTDPTQPAQMVTDPSESKQMVTDPSQSKQMLEKARSLSAVGDPEPASTESNKSE